MNDTNITGCKVLIANAEDVILGDTIVTDGHSTKTVTKADLKFFRHWPSLKVALVYYPKHYQGKIVRYQRQI